MNKTLIFVLGMLCTTFFLILFVPSEWYIISLTIALIIAICQGLYHYYHEPTNLSKMLLYIACGILFASVLVTTWTIRVIKPIEAFDGSTENIELTVIEKPTVYEGYMSFDAKVNRIGDNKENFTVRVTSKEIFEADIGDVLKVFGQFSLPRQTQRGYDLAHGVWIRVQLREVTQHTTPSKIPHMLFPRCVSHKIEKEFENVMSEESAGFISALLLGAKSSMTATQKRQLRQTGLSHIVAVSGFHISFLTGLLIQLFRRRLGMTLAIPILLFFTLMTGATPSVLRAVIVQIVWIFSFPAHREADTLTSMGIAAVCILCMNPYSVQDVGLWLSFGSSAGITLWGTRLKYFMLNSLPRYKVKIFNSLLEGVCASLSTTICAQIFILPILVVYFQEMSFISPIANIMLSSLVGVMFMLSVGCAVFVFILPSFLPLLTSVTEWAVRLFYKAVEILSNVPFAYTASDLYLLFAILGGYILIPLSFYAVKRGANGGKAVLKCVYLLVVLWTVCGLLRLNSDMRIGSVLVPQMRGGQMVSVIADDDCLLVNCGGYADVYEGMEELRLHRVDNVDLLVFTDYNSVSVNRYKNFAEKMDVSKIVLPVPYDEKSANTAKEITQTALLYGTKVQILSESEMMYERTYEVGNISATLAVAGNSLTDRGRLCVYAVSGDMSLLVTGNVKTETLKEATDKLNFSPNIVALSSYYGQNLLPDNVLSPDTTIICTGYDGVDEKVWDSFGERNNVYFPDYEKILVQFTL